MATPKLGVPRLESGDRLTRAEFHRRDEAWILAELAADPADA